jgi:hypothetical protein
MERGKNDRNYHANPQRKISIQWLEWMEIDVALSVRENIARAFRQPGTYPNNFGKRGLKTKAMKRTCQYYKINRHHCKSLLYLWHFHISSLAGEHCWSVSQREIYPNYFCKKGSQNEKSYETHMPINRCHCRFLLFLWLFTFLVVSASLAGTMLVGIALAARFKILLPK